MKGMTMKKVIFSTMGAICSAVSSSSKETLNSAHMDGGSGSSKFIAIAATALVLGLGATAMTVGSANAAIDMMDDNCYIDGALLDTTGLLPDVVRTAMIVDQDGVSVSYIAELTQENWGTHDSVDMMARPLSDPDKWDETGVAITANLLSDTSEVDALDYANNDNLMMPGAYSDVYIQAATQIDVKVTDLLTIASVEPMMPGVSGTFILATFELKHPGGAPSDMMASTHVDWAVPGGSPADMITAFVNMDPGGAPATMVATSMSAA